ncbi:ferrous iron transport protein A [Finegoldia sp. BIOML-A2]|mgnify:FL=1|uniref:Ferrous iron transport protein A n=2 Tax=Finegoldia magna TaxID=1260 RepID=A0A233VGN3_FINMA|nr:MULTISPECIES: FeoA family protein [Finegoldia]EFH93998.1 FeoA domain protein [Finegoldia magna ATCC 53516]MBS5776752.1 ferrous iron transport protein A [Finegoldia magna]MBS5941987.1 ferrous iron transport protein A [Finegoldia magna]MBS5964815.1 ferrous iron transport protein A [Finegoldia magna]MBS5966195.1 ferrous iron transport protein A [Finegoldia magna]
MNLALVPLNEDFEIVKIKKIKDDSQKKLLNNMGFVEGAVVTVVSESYGNLIVKIKGSRVAIGKDIAMRIMVNHI